MKVEALNDNTYKITLDRSETLFAPFPGDSRDMQLFLGEVIERLRDEHGIDLPGGRLLAEAFSRSDGTCVIFVSSAPEDIRDGEPRYLAADISGIVMLRAVCRALYSAGFDGEVYCGEDPAAYRIVFTDPPSGVKRICLEFCECGEITPLFAAQTAEYLTHIASAKKLAEILK